MREIAGRIYEIIKITQLLAPSETLAKQKRQHFAVYAVRSQHLSHKNCMLLLCGYPKTTLQSLRPAEHLCDENSAACSQRSL